MNAPADRKLFLGSSDMAAILGLSPWATPLDVYLAKRGEAPQVQADPQKEKLFRRGKRLEPIICEMLTEERGLKIVARNERYHDAEHPFLSSEIDAEADVEGEIINVECKTVHPFTAWKYGEEGTDEVPIEYACQAMFSLMVTGRKRCIFGVLFGADNLVTYDLARDEDTIREMRGRAVSFWHDHVMAGVPPAPVNLPDVQKLFRRDVATQKEATPEVAEWTRKLVELRNMARSVDDEIDQLQFQIGSFMLGAEQMDKPEKPGRHVLTFSGAPVLTVTLQAQERLDSKALREKYPLIADECSKKTTFFRYDSPRKKRQ